MAIYIVQGRYTGDAIKAMVAKPDDRREAVEALMKASGFRLVEYYVTMGKYDFMAIAEGEGGPDMLAPLIVAAASGGVGGMVTTQAFSTAEFKTACEKASTLMRDFRPAGG